ncbi:MAG: transporter substrate-binding domain-containing protein [Desulfobacterales bacterium]|nr:transporter substrate-binding domain-containing protein [Desulfobacterales bacterium]
MKKFMFFILFLFLILISCPIYAQKTLLFSAVEGSIIDDFVFNQILKDGYKRIGIKVQKQAVPSRRSLFYSNNGTTDGEIARITGISEKYSNLIMVPVVVMSSRIVAFTLKNKRISINGWESLQGKRVSIQRGMIVVKTNAEKNGWNTVKVNDSERNRLFKLLLYDRVEVAVTDVLSGLSILSDLKISGEDISKIVMLEPQIFPVKLYHFLHRKNENLIPKITTSLQEMEKEGVIKKKMDGFISQFTK